MSAAMKINFNTLGLASGGGNRVIIELANRLSKRGHEVIISAITLDKFGWYGKENIKAKLNIAYPSVITRVIRQRIQHSHYFDVQADLLQKIMPDCDANIATFCVTVAPTVNSGKGKSFYLVQSFEPYFFQNPKWIKCAEESYKLPAVKLCVSHWLEQKTGGIYVGNGVNTEIFNPKYSFAEKEPNSVLYFYRGMASKRDDLAFECLLKLYETKKVKIHIVSQQNLAENVKVDFAYELHIDPSDVDLANIYSKSRILLYTSLFEGFGLPPLEALACGTNVVSTPFTGNEFLVDGENCFLAENAEELVVRALGLLQNDNVSLKQIEDGKATVANYTFERMVDRVEKALVENAGQKS